MIYTCIFEIWFLAINKSPKINYLNSIHVDMHHMLLPTWMFPKWNEFLSIWTHSIRIFRILQVNMPTFVFHQVDMCTYPTKYANSLFSLVVSLHLKHYCLITRNIYAISFLFVVFPLWRFFGWTFIHYF